MQCRCVAAYGDVKVGDLVDVPDGAAVSPVHLVPVTEPATPAPGPAAPSLPAPAAGAGEPEPSPAVLAAPGTEGSQL